jgi:Flp pilus assembly protein TadB
MALLPSEPGAVQETLADTGSATATTFEGGPGIVTGIVVVVVVVLAGVGMVVVVVVLVGVGIVVVVVVVVVTTGSAGVARTNRAKLKPKTFFAVTLNR